MIVKYRKRFLNELPNQNSIAESGKIEKMHGYEAYYKVRLGQYRVGIYQENDVIVLECVLHIKDIYRYFP